MLLTYLVNRTPQIVMLLCWLCQRVYNPSPNITPSYNSWLKYNRHFYVIHYTSYDYVTVHAKNKMTFLLKWNGAKSLTANNVTRGNGICVVEWEQYYTKKRGSVWLVNDTWSFTLCKWIETTGHSFATSLEYENIEHTSSLHCHLWS